MATPRDRSSSPSPAPPSLTATLPRPSPTDSTARSGAAQRPRSAATDPALVAAGSAFPLSAATHVATLRGTTTHPPADPHATDARAATTTRLDDRDSRSSGGFAPGSPAVTVASVSRVTAHVDARADADTTLLAAYLGEDADTTAGLDDLDNGEANSGATSPGRWSVFVAWERDMLNLYVAFTTLFAHLRTPETLLGYLVAIASTLAFALLPPGQMEVAGPYLTARLDFTLLGTAIVFPVSFLINETFRRRETALQRLAHVKALACQIQAAILLWRWKDARATEPAQEWEDHVAATLQEAVTSMSAILLLPKWSANRHLYTPQGLAFRRRVVERQRALTHRFVRAMTELHVAVETLKACGLTASEATRLNQYTYLLHHEMEGLLMIKSYRTTSIARSFARCMVLICPAFYGPYFAWVAYDSGADAPLGLGFAIALSLMTTTVLQGLVKVQRALEDPFSSVFPAEVIAVQEETDDTLLRMGVVRAVAREARGRA